LASWIFWATSARRGALERQRRDLAERVDRLKTRLAESESQREPLLRATVSPAAMAEAGAAVAEAAAGIDSASNSSTKLPPLVRMGEPISWFCSRTSAEHPRFARGERVAVTDHVCVPES